MRIGLLLDDTLDSTDGVQQYVLLLGRWLSSRGHEVHYLVGQTTRTQPATIHSLSKNVRVSFNGNTMSVPLPANTRLLQSLAADLSLDVLHVQVPYSPLLAGRLIRMMPSTTAVVGTFHILAYSQVSTWANRVLRIINRTTGRRFDAMMATSEPAQQFARHIYGYDARVVSNPVDISHFCGVSNNTAGTHIVFLGRLVERKGALQLLKAIAYMRQHSLYNDMFTVTVAGKGPQLEALQAFAQHHDLHNYVSFAGFIAEADKAMLLAGADIAVFPSVSGESFGISVVEALAAARGVVLAGDNPGYKSVMSGLAQYEDQLFDPNNTAAFAQKIVYWLSRPSARRAAAIRQQGYALTFDINRIGELVEATYHQALRRRR